MTSDEPAPTPEARGDALPTMTISTPSNGDRYSAALKKIERALSTEDLRLGQVDDLHIVGLLPSGAGVLCSIRVLVRETGEVSSRATEAGQ